MNYKVQSYIQKLDNLFVLAEKIDDDEVKGHFAKYLCVKTSGLLEVFFKAQISDIVDGKTPKVVANYVNYQFKSFSSIDTRKIIKVFSLFSQSWVDEFNTKMNEEHTSALNSIISNRNNIAHGQNDSISLKNAKEYYEKMKEILVILERIMKIKK